MDQHLVIALVDVNGGANNVKIILAQKRRLIFCSGKAEKKFTVLFLKDLISCWVPQIQALFFIFFQTSRQTDIPFQSA